MRRVAGDDSRLHFQSLGGNQDIGIKGSRISGGFALLPGYGPERGGSLPCCGRYRQVGEDSVQLVEAIKPRRWELPSLNEPRQLATDFVVGHFRQIDCRSG